MVTLSTTDNITWNAAVSGMTTGGTVVAAIAAGTVQDGEGNPNTASTSTDNTVTWTPLVAVPNVAGQTQANASSTLTGAGFILGQITQQCSASVAAGLVISQNPAANAQAAWGSAVTLVVSTGPCAEGEGEPPAPPTEAELRAQLTAAFDTMDSNGDDTVSFAEAQAALPGLTQAVFNAVNTSGDGQITRAEAGLDEPGANGCAGCSGGKRALFDQMKDSLNGLFLGGLSLMVLLASAKHRP